MAVVTELFRSEDNGTLSFGDYTLAQKAKKGDIQFEGDIYKIKTFKTMTKLDKNGQLIFESVPGQQYITLLQQQMELHLRLNLHLMSRLL